MHGITFRYDVKMQIQQMQLTRGGPRAWRLGKGLNIPQHKNQLDMKYYTGPQNLMDSFHKYIK
jgi:hypothetical protein